MNSENFEYLIKYLECSEKNDEFQQKLLEVKHALKRLDAIESRTVIDLNLPEENSNLEEPMVVINGEWDKLRLYNLNEDELKSFQKFRNFQ